MSAGLIRLSEEQEQIVREDFKDILLIKAYAGSGKSFTLKQFASARAKYSILYLVFNRDMKKDAERSFRGMENVDVKTINGLAYSHTGKRYEQRMEVFGDIKPNHLEKYFTQEEKNTYMLGNGGNGDDGGIELYSSVLLTILIEFMSGDMEIERFIQDIKRRKQELSIIYGVHASIIIKKIREAWTEISNPLSSMPTLHDVYLKVFQLEGAQTKHYNYVIVDESQDINPVMTDIAMSLPADKRIFCGDPFQSIYSWRGALDSMGKIKRKYGGRVETRYLSSSYRCSPHIGEIADSIIKQIGAEKTFKGVGKPKSISMDTPVCMIGRTNGGVLDFCFDTPHRKIFFAGGIKKYKLGIIRDLLYLKSKKEWVKDSFLKRFAGIKEVREYADKTKDVALLSAVGIIFKYSSEKYSDMTIFERLKDLEERAVSRESEADVIVTTAHKSKGLEWDRVHLLDDFPLGEKAKEEMPESLVAEEMRLLYVSATRATTELVMPDYLHAVI